jgi:hydrogenase maturation protease
MTKRARIVGFGNPDRGDDAAGLLVARRLRELGIESADESGDPLSLIESWGNADDLIIVDAVVTGARPGTITARELQRSSIAPVEGETSTHGFGIAQAIDLGRKLNCLPERIQIYGIEGTRFEVGAPPSMEVLSAVERLAQFIHFKAAIGENGDE